MILTRLYELASWANLLDDPSVVKTPVACVLKVNREGGVAGLIDLREDLEVPAKGKKGKPKTVKTAGVAYPVPVRPVIWDAKAKRWKLTDPASSGGEKPAVFLADTLARVLPLDGLIETEAKKDPKKNPQQEVAKFQAQRSTFWRFLRFAADDSKNPTLLALAAFWDRVVVDPEVHRHLAAEVEEKKLPLAALCTLELTADDASVLEQSGIMTWWRKFHEQDTAAQQAGQFRGLCQVTREEAPIPSSVQTRINGLVQIGCRAEAYLVTGLESANSYGLEGAQAGMVSARGVDGFTRALHALIDNQLPSRKDKTRVGGIRSSLRIGNKDRATLFLFWTRDMEASAGLEILDAGPDQMAGLLESLHKSASAGSSIPAEQQDQFRVLTLSGNSARVVVRDYLEGPLPRFQQNILSWFADLRIADTSEAHAGRPNEKFTINNLAGSTVPRKADGMPDWDKLPPETTNQLMHAALTGGLVPDSVLVACLGRLRAEGSDGFRPARMGLIKLCLNRTHCKENPMPPTLDATGRPDDRSYACGRLLAFLARCQSPRDFGTSAQILERFFGTASTSPRAVFPTLLRLNRHHIAKIRDDNRGFAFNLEAELEERLHPLRPSTDQPADFPALLSLPEQGRFALGFYHQRADYRRASAEAAPPPA